MANLASRPTVWLSAILPVTPSVARPYGRLFADLREAGTPIPINDVWIAAATLDCGGHLLTLDDLFDKTPSVDRTVLAVPNRPSRS